MTDTQTVIIYVHPSVRRTGHMDIALSEHPGAANAVALSMDAYAALKAEIARLRAALSKAVDIGANFDEATRDDTRDLGKIIYIARAALKETPC